MRGRSLLLLTLLQCVCLSAQAEVTNPQIVSPLPIVLPQAPQCVFQARTRFNIREVNSNRVCDSTASLNDQFVEVVQVSGSWVQVPNTRCAGGIGRLHRTSFREADWQKIVSGQCQQQGAPAPTETVGSGSAVTSNHPDGHEFPLPRCLGLKNRGGQGHFGASRRRGRSRYRHTGCDYYSPQGTEVRSPCTGEVTQSFSGRRSGHTIYIKCDNGDQYRMLHLHATKPRGRHPRGKVQQGTIVGGVGNSGNARRQAPHLHLEAFRGGRRIDPQSVWACGGDSGH